MTELTTTEVSFEVLAKAVDDAAAAVAELDEAPRGTAEELRAAIEAVHKAGLVAIVRKLRGDEAGRALLFELVDDPLLRMLFSLHGIIRTGLPAGIGAAGEHTGKQPTGGQCGCGDSGGECGCGHSHGDPRQAGPTLTPLSAIRRLPGPPTSPGRPDALAAGTADADGRPGGTA